MTAEPTTARPRRVAKGKTPQRSIRVADPLWNAAQDIAVLREENLTADVCVPALERYVKRHAHLLEAEGTSSP